jgi:uncharacterized protein (TIGR02757 family)
LDKFILKELLDDEVAKRNSYYELSFDRPDPLLILHKYPNEWVALTSALFAYGKASQILKFLNSLDFEKIFASSIDKKVLRNILQDKYYRFQKNEDVINFFYVLKIIQNEFGSLEDIFLQGYRKNGLILEGINNLILTLNKLNKLNSHGMNFLIGKEVNIQKPHRSAPLKRWNLLLRWLVRKDNLDLGLWKNIKTCDLLIPLDTHTFNISQTLGLLKRKQYDLKAVIELTKSLKEFDKNDPVKYDFAIYRIGQEKILISKKYNYKYSKTPF